MSWLLRHNWLWSLLAFLVGAAITWVLLERRQPAAPPQPQVAEPVEPIAEKEEVLVAATVGAVEADVPEGHQAAGFSRLMQVERVEEPTLFDVEADATEPRMRAEAPPGRYGEGSAEAVPHQGPPDGFTIKGNAQSMLFHTPDSPYYGRTKPEVWFRTESDAERAGFTKYTRRPRKSADPRD